jgi:threonine aldolase
VLALENTHNRCGGTVLPQAWVEAAAAMAHDAGMKVHMDGARLYNAAVAGNISVGKLVKDCDTVSLCLSKGLGAPAGSVIAGSADFIARCRRLRKVLGGGMRQAGVLAACGIVGLKETTKVLAQDHARAKSLARGLSAVPGVLLDARRVQTNIVFFDLNPAALDVRALRARLASEAAVAAAAAAAGTGPALGHRAPLADGAAPSPPEKLLSEVVSEAMDTSEAFAALLEHYSGGVKIGSYGGHRLRAVTHHQVRDDDVEKCIDGAYRAAEALRVA